MLDININSAPCRLSTFRIVAYFGTSIGPLLAQLLRFQPAAIPGSSDTTWNATQRMYFPDEWIEAELFCK